MSKLIIIGAGPGGYVAALRAAQLGAKVTVIEKEAVGGTCLNWGCIPTKTLLASVETLSLMKEAGKLGIKAEGITPDFPAITARKEKIIANLRKGIEFLFKNKQVELIQGTAKVLAPGKVAVTKTDGTREELTADKIIIASGSESAQPSFFPFDSERVITSKEILSLTCIPESLLIVGAGAIGAEFACIFSVLGTKVTIVEMLPHVLPTEDTEIAREFEKQLKRKRIKVHTGTKISQMEVTGGKVTSTLSSGEAVETEKALIAVGRKLNSQGLGLEEAGIKTEQGKILVNKQMETNVREIYAIGDVVGGALLAHKASAEGIIAAENACGEKTVMDYQAIPGCIFTLPEVASVGLTEQQAQEKGKKIRIGKFPFRALGKAQALGQVEGMVKIIADEATDKILGIHIIGPHATDLIAEGVLAIKQGLTARDMGNVIHAHPTLAEGIMEAAHAIHGRAIHLP